MEMNDLWLKMLNWLKNDFIVIVICLSCLLACVYTIYTTTAYQAEVNRQWQEQWDKSGCAKPYYVPNVTFNIGGMYDEIKD